MCGLKPASFLSFFHFSFKLIQKGSFPTHPLDPFSSFIPHCCLKLFLFESQWIRNVLLYPSHISTRQQQQWQFQWIRDSKQINKQTSGIEQEKMSGQCWTFKFVLLLSTISFSSSLCAIGYIYSWNHSWMSGEKRKRWDAVDANVHRGEKSE